MTMKKEEFSNYGDLYNKLKDYSKNNIEYYDALEMSQILIEFLKKERTSKGISQRELAKMCNTKQSQIARIENYDISPTINSLVRMAVALDVSFKPKRNKDKEVTKTKYIILGCGKSFLEQEYDDENDTSFSFDNLEDSICSMC